jgi:hypothetical protein
MRHYSARGCSTEHNETGIRLVALAPAAALPPWLIAVLYFGEKGAIGEKLMAFFIDF